MVLRVCLTINIFFFFFASSSDSHFLIYARSYVNEKRSRDRYEAF